MLYWGYGYSIFLFVAITIMACLMIIMLIWKKENKMEALDKLVIRELQFPNANYLHLYKYNKDENWFKVSNLEVILEKIVYKVQYGENLLYHWIITNPKYNESIKVWIKEFLINKGYKVTEVEENKFCISW